MNRIYADFNATTPLSVVSRNSMARAFEIWGNPSSSHSHGRQANEIIEESRCFVARAAGVFPLEVVFTSGGSEANTLALMGSFFLKAPQMRLLTTTVEHSSVRDTAGLLQEQGVPVDYLQVKRSGLFDLEVFESQITEFRPTLVSVMAANNETGVLFPLKEIFQICQQRGIILHTDAVQAFGKVSPEEWNFCDLISITAHKIFGPKGAGALIVRRGTPLVATHYGGAQEIKRRGGTENVVGLLGFGGAASEISTPDQIEKVRILRDSFEKTLLETLPGVSLNGADVKRISNTSSIRFEGIASEVLLGALDLEGISVSAGSACSSGSISPSHVLLAMGLNKQEAKECLRFSWGKTTSREEVDTVLQAVIKHVTRIRDRKRKA
ncbi:MAG: cysteine desulfurase [Proteobacteria bacterium]|nr:cysteine desulfurase [Pseudomonadota bacterium]